MSSFRRAAPGAALSGTARGAGIPAEEPILGTKRWVDGSLLISSGHAQLDTYVGGGLPLGSMVLIEEDSRNIHAPALVGRFIAEGYATNQPIVLAGPQREEDLRAQLAAAPLNVSRGSKDTVALEAMGAAAPASEASRERFAGADGTAEAVSEESWDRAGHGLSIAWQYRKYMTAGAATGSAPSAAALRAVADARTSKFGHTYDHNRSVTPAVLASSRTSVVSAWASLGSSVEDPGAASARRGEAILRGVTDALAQAQTAHPPTDDSARAPGAAGGEAVVSRVVILGLDGPTWPGSTGRTDTVAFGERAAVLEHHYTPHLPILWLLALLRRQLAIRRELPSGSSGGRRGGEVILVSMATHTLPPGVAVRVRAYFDLVIKLHAFADPPADAARPGTYAADTDVNSGVTTGAAPEFASYTGVLQLRKLPLHTGSLAGHQPTTMTYAFKHDRRSFAIDVPHLPPEALPPPGSTPSDSGSGSGSRAGGLACASGGGGGGSLDF
jgi:hypothetical protein